MTDFEWIKMVPYILGILALLVELGVAGVVVWYVLAIITITKMKEEEDKGDHNEEEK